MSYKQQKIIAGTFEPWEFIAVESVIEKRGIKSY
jgi:hypothetical protein